MLPAAFSREHGDRLAGLLPAELLPLFDDRFIGSHILFEEYVHRLAIRVVRDAGIESAAREPGTPGEIAARAGLDADWAPAAVGWLLATLLAQGHAARGPDGRYSVPVTLPDPDLQEVTDAQERHAPSALASHRMADLAAEIYPSALRGTTSGDATLFAPDRIGTWFEYFSNDNVLYAISNRIGAIAAEQALPPDGKAVLELGGGLGSGAAAFLQRLAETGRLSAIRSYRFTEIAPSFLRRGQREIARQFPGVPVTFGRLDMDHPFREAGVEDGAFALVYGVNTLHVARDLEFTLAEIRRALEPEGRLVLSECVRPYPGRPVCIEFVFNLLEAFRAPRLVEPWRPNGGFLTPEQWTAALETCGFREVTIYPEVARIREVYPSFVAAAIVAVRA